MNKRILHQYLTLDLHTAEAEFWVEEFRKNKWKEVDGPHDTQNKADAAARKYSKEHPGVKVRVVGYQ